MKLFTFLLIIMVNFVNFSSINAQNKQLPELKNSPKGTYIKGKTLFAAKGYRFEQVKGSNSNQVLLRDNGGGLGTTTFQCACKLGEGCEAEISDNSISCKSSSCNSCFMYVITSNSTKALYFR